MLDGLLPVSKSIFTVNNSHAKNFEWFHSYLSHLEPKVVYFIWWKKIILYKDLIEKLVCPNCLPSLTKFDIYNLLCAVLADIPDPRSLRLDTPGQLPLHLTRALLVVHMHETKHLHPPWCVWEFYAILLIES